MVGKDGTERRKKFRLFSRIPVVCIIPTESGKKIKPVISGDISAEGMYFEIDEMVPLKSLVELRFQLPHGKETIEATAQVCRIQMLKDAFGLGIIFTQIREEDRSAIEEFIERLNIKRLMSEAVTSGASDIHLLCEQPPVLRINGELQFLDSQPLHGEEIPQLVFSLMTKEQIRNFEKDKEMDFGIQYDINTRFRVNVHQQRGYVEATFRRIESKQFSFEELHIPQVVKDLARQKDGLILVTGPTGSGKTTTIAAMIDLINRERRAVIITLERPIEYVFTNGTSVIKQREVGVDTNSFSAALKSSLRQDPNIIVIGELDDIETVRTALVAAEAGYLVIATFHAPDTIQSIDRLANMFPPESRRQVLSQLSNCLKGIVAQMLIPSKDRKSRILAAEVVIATDAVKRVIRKDELYQIANLVQTGGDFKMQSLAQSIKQYIEFGTIETETALFYSQELSKYSS